LKGVEAVWSASITFAAFWPLVRLL